MMQYASLVGPLLGFYYPLPFDDQISNRLALNTSRLKGLWCSVYSEEQADEQIRKWGGIKLPPSYVRQLDYDSSIVEQDRIARGV